MMTSNMKRVYDQISFSWGYTYKYIQARSKADHLLTLQALATVNTLGHMQADGPL